MSRNLWQISIFKYKLQPKLLKCSQNLFEEPRHAEVKKSKMLISRKIGFCDFYSYHYVHFHEMFLYQQVRANEAYFEKNGLSPLAQVFGVFFRTFQSINLWAIYTWPVSLPFLPRPVSYYHVSFILCSNMTHIHSLPSYFVTTQTRSWELQTLDLHSCKLRKLVESHRYVSEV